MLWVIQLNLELSSRQSYQQNISDQMRNTQRRGCLLPMKTPSDIGGEYCAIVACNGCQICCCGRRPSAWRKQRTGQSRRSTACTETTLVCSTGFAPSRAGIHSKEDRRKRKQDTNTRALFTYRLSKTTDRGNTPRSKTAARATNPMYKS